MLFYIYVLHTIEETPKRNYLFIKFEHRKTKDMEYLSMRQNQYMHTQKKKTQKNPRNIAIIAVLHLAVKVKPTTRSQTKIKKKTTTSLHV